MHSGKQRQQNISHSQDWSWPLWPILPLYPYGQRRTLRKEIVKDTIWTFDQLQGIFYVTVPIRMTVVRMIGGGLFVYAPIAPTRECVRLVNELVEKYGEVRYIILPTISGLEHKVYVGPFARKFPTAEVFVTPNQWSFPLNLPLSWLGLPRNRTYLLPVNSGDAPFAAEFDYATLGPLDIGFKPFAEVVFWHSPSQTLLAVDTVLSVPAEPPDILNLDPYPLLFHAKDDVFDVVEDTPTNRCVGWQKICLFGLYFQVGALEVVPTGEIFKNVWKAGDRSKRAYFGLLPWRWKSDWQRSFTQLRQDGRLLVAPILQTLILNRDPKQVMEWVEKVASWNFRQIIPCHFDAPIQASGYEFRQGFSFLEKDSGGYLPETDLQFLRKLDDKLTKIGALR
ncbi:MULTISPECIES: DUF4336 domain-containing protein [Okeania]|uniref:DUF4336 domain-containing protein n=1 Tax=Okeania TaxID=1458928 RepID=UPI000F532015|nr:MULTISPECIES: DUF4336 domain-containing protein [Okeania]NES76893.1 DUF4336 domain-containing protein [Okeania sp. SIO1H4]NET20522.1 DUF4336 domain-containing protein [Okeania sp. SIO1H5]NET93689.1 DUF4336 domain-containing protein [Okeania sp. SIO1H2]RQH17866.1 DUF4336 domain-containing protein [Okeania hirsuta]